MKIETKYHGNLEIEDQQIFQFEQGIPGFLDEKKFVLLPISEDGLYLVLQSIINPYVAFIVTNPFLIEQSYEFVLDDHTIEHLEIKEESEVQIYSILTLQDPFNQSTMNLVAPVVINSRNKKGKQMIMSNTDYSIKTPIFTEDARMKR